MQVYTKAFQALKYTSIHLEHKYLRSFDAGSLPAGTIL